MAANTPSRHIEHQSLPGWPGLELVRAHYSGFVFDRHVHLDYHIGLVDQGAQAFMHKGQRLILSPGSLSTFNPDEVHDGAGHESGDYQVRLIRLPMEAMATLGEQLGGDGRLHFFKGPMVADPILYQGLLQLHNQQHSPEPLAAQSHMLLLMAHLLLRHGEPGLKPARHQGLSRFQLADLKGYLLAHLDSKHNLPTLAERYQLSQYQFLRQFRAATGITPHAYLTSLRVEAARQHLKSGMLIKDVAAAVGFFDQSHLVKAFKRHYNLPPQSYQQQICR
ncbi:AraC family transcriptional regulator [Gallaecimonas pentaromativorans]|uniref:AraC family transcriptional regulator n=1 Tax=Gallaecimonas pentaromativorans TaxID=584787 RepID=A0A3N1PAL4_9GAMM|nr:AraC family transcriptional regulator [Gallaecimonas pentaromativorans]ROQ24127.1 AraC family transcriptional regulator [Gallaecimonas pentaromativorans]